MNTNLDIVLLVLFAAQVVIYGLLSVRNEIAARGDRWGTRKGVLMWVVCTILLAILLAMGAGLIQLSNPQGLLWTGWLIASITMNALFWSKSSWKHWDGFKYKTHAAWAFWIWGIAALIV